MLFILKQFLLILLPFSLVASSCSTQVEVSELTTKPSKNNDAKIGTKNTKSNNTNDINNTNNQNKPFLEITNTLKSKGLEQEFTNLLLEHPTTVYDPKYIKMNVTNFFTSSGKSNYSVHYNKTGVDKTTTFIKENLAVLNEAERKYAVGKEYIASILWVETRQGSYTGDNNIISVFLTTATSNLPQTVNENKKAIVSYFAENQDKVDTSKDINYYLDKYEQRANKKANWAIGELLALQSIYKQGGTDIFKLRGSYAGAFGWSQFLPSSYISWAVDGNSDGVKDLFNKVDAIYSVANYLKSNGFDGTSSGIKKSIFHYNNSNDYVNAVITLANKVKDSLTK